MKPLLLIVLLLLANTVAAAEPISEKQELTKEELEARFRAVAESQGMAPSGGTTTKRKYTTQELDAMEDAVQSRHAEKQRAQLAKDNYACLLEYRTSAPVTQPPLGSSMEAVIMQGSIEQNRENKYVRACLESKGWVPARNAESTK